MIPLSASKTASQRRKRKTTAKRNRAGGAINSRKLLESTRPAAAGLSESSGLRRGGRRWCRRFTFVFAAKDCVQFAAKKQEQTSEIHPGEQDNDGGKGE